MLPTRRRFTVRLRALRAKRGMSQDALAKRAGISRGYLLRLEAGRQDPTLGILTKLAKALKVKVGELLE
ncbi:MAG: helix-turn-helix transcriptional regulator [candidate division NC10 bacterium]